MEDSRMVKRLLMTVMMVGVMFMLSGEKPKAECAQNPDTACWTENNELYDDCHYIDCNGCLGWDYSGGICHFDSEGCYTSITGGRCRCFYCPI
jgi:hypothetical protein